VEEHVPAILASPRLVERGTGFAIEQIVADRRGDADDLHRLPVVPGGLARPRRIANHLADRIVGAEQLSREALVDDRDPRRRRGRLFGG
jgi:hypothetical protein